MEFMCIMEVRKVVFFNLEGRMGLLKDFCKRGGRFMVVVFYGWIVR